MNERLLSVDEALETMLTGLEPLAIEWVGVDEAAGRVLAAPLRARLSQPPWDDSAMYGFAVRSADVAAATAERPVRLRVVMNDADLYSLKSDRAQLRPGGKVARRRGGNRTLIAIGNDRGRRDGNESEKDRKHANESLHGLHPYLWI